MTVESRAYIITLRVAGVAEWQTQWSQKPPRETSYRFDSDLRHHYFELKISLLQDMERLIFYFRLLNG